MWLEFFSALPLFFLLIYVPGWLIARCLTRDAYVALAMAPLVSTCAYSVLTIIYGALGIFTTWLTLFAPLTLVGVAALVLLRRGHRGEAWSEPISVSTQETWKEELKSYLPYVIFGTLVCFAFFIKPLDGPSSFTWRTDNSQHLNLIARYVNTGNWSMLHASIYEDPSQAAIMNSSYYPSGWHILVCMIMSALGSTAPFASNVANAVLIAFTMPTTVYLFMRTVLRDKPFAVRLGAIFPLSFTVFPWRIIIPEGRSPFFLGLLFSLGIVVMVVTLCEEAFERKLHGSYIALLFISLLACGFAHPSGVFSGGVILVPYLVSVVWRALVAEDGPKARLKGLLGVGVLLVAIGAVWMFCYSIPMIKAMGEWTRFAYCRRLDAVLQVVFMGFKDMPAQPYLALFVWIGIAYSLYRARHLWLTGSFAIFSVLHIIDAVTNNPIKRILTAFWYTDFSRIAASASVAAVPLAALGLYATVRVAQSVFNLVSTQDDKPKRQFVAITIPLLTVLVSALVIYCPSYHIPHGIEKVKTSFGHVYKRAHKYNNQDNNTLRPEEEKFLRKVKKIVGDDLVINFVFDGSCYAYATNDINVYIRRNNSIYYSGDAKYIIAHIDKLGSDEKLTELLNKYDAHYILLLDIDETAEEASVYEDGFNTKVWRGLIKVDDETPGLETLLSEGDMRLYKIVDDAA